MITKEFNLIWLGRPIPEKYLRTIVSLTSVAKKSGFKINLWVDKDINYHKTAALIDVNIHELPNFRIKYIDELIDAMKSEPFYQQGDRLKKIVSFINRELSGSKNLAAASDWIRYIILHLYGGYYFDTDTQFKLLKFQGELKEDSSWIDFKSHLFISYGNNHNFILNEVSGGNDIIACSRKHIILEKALLMAIEKYENLDGQLLPEHGLHEFFNQLLPAHVLLEFSNEQKSFINCMDVKRYDGNNSYPYDYNRRRLTIGSSGPGVLCDAFEEFFDTIQLFCNSLDKFNFCDKSSSLETLPVLSFSWFSEAFWEDLQKKQEQSGLKKNYDNEIEYNMLKLELLTKQIHENSFTSDLKLNDKKVSQIHQLIRNKQILIGKINAVEKEQANKLNRLQIHSVKAIIESLPDTFWQTLNQVITVSKPNKYMPEIASTILPNVTESSLSKGFASKTGEIANLEVESVCDCTWLSSKFELNKKAYDFEKINTSFGFWKSKEQTKHFCDKQVLKTFNPT